MKTLEEFMQSHQRVVLQFSAGKDSAACLYLMEPYWDRIAVVWSNQGNPYPETVEYMDKIRKMVPHFVEIIGDQPNYIKEFGYPVDVIPVRSELKLASAYACCWHNSWYPMLDWCFQHGVDGIIRGQKSCDVLKSPAKTGDILNGAEFFLPIYDWSDEDVLEFLGPERLPDSYKRGLISSLDCMNCTAYADRNPGRLADLELIYPPAAQEVRKIHRHIYDETMAIFDLMEN